MIRRRLVSVVLTLALTVIVGFVGAGAAGALPRLPALPALPRIPGLPKLEGFFPPASQADLDDSFDRVSRSLTKKVPGRVGLAVTAVGSDLTMSFGTVKTARAWSTLKVPVSIAAERANGSRVDGDVKLAIRESDNIAAEALWDSMGTNRRAVDGVSQVLHEGHDLTTRVQSGLDHPTSFPGYTKWSLELQSRFGAHLPCLPDSSLVLGHMRHVDTNQRWGVKIMRKRGVSTAVKGGWGPVSDATGKYVVRQLGVVTTPRGAFAVSMAALPSSGSFEDGTAMLNRVGRWVRDHLDELPAGGC